MVRPRNVEKFHRYVLDLWKYLKDLYKNDTQTKQLLNKVYSKHRSMDQVKYLEFTLNNLSPYVDYFTRRDEFIFTPEFGKRPLNFLIGFDFRQVWKLELTLEQKRIIFRYLEFLYIQASLALRKNTAKVNEIIDAIKMEQEIEKEAAENPDMFKDEENQGGGGLLGTLLGGGGADFASLFGDDNILVDLANDLKDEFDLGEILGDMLGGDGGLKPGANPMDAINNLSRNPKMQNILETLSNKVQQKMQDRNISQEELLASADKLRDGLMKNVKGMPGGSQIKKMINNMDLEKMSQQFGAAGQGEPSPEDFINQMMSGVDQQQLNAEFNPEPTQMPLEMQQMLAQMQQMAASNSPEQMQEWFNEQMSAQFAQFAEETGEQEDDQQQRRLESAEAEPEPQPDEVD